MAVERGQEEQEQDDQSARRRSPTATAPLLRTARPLPTARRRPTGPSNSTNDAPSSSGCGPKGWTHTRPISLWNSRERIADVIDAHDPAALEQGEHPELRHEIAGRLVARREHGKTAFLDVRDLSGTIQVVVRVDAVGQEEYDRVLNLDIGDIVGVKGVVYVTQRGTAGAGGEGVPRC